jgi:hypothetical protein
VTFQVLRYVKETNGRQPRWEVNAEGLLDAFGTAYGTPVCLVTVFGRAREGKSFLMNRLIGQDTFRVLPTNRPCTQGADIHVAPLIRGQPLTCYIDLEGLGDKGGTYDVQLLTPFFVVSQVLVFNWKGRIARDDILQQLGVLSRASQSIQVSAQDKAAGLAHLHIVLRDCVRSSDETDVRERLFDNEDDDAGRDDAAKSRNCIRADLRGAFQSITITCLPPPSADARALDNGDLCAEKLTDDFNLAVDQLKAKLKSQLQPRRLAGQPLTGSAVAGLLHVLVKAINEKRDTLVPHSLYEDYQRMEGLKVRETQTPRSLCLMLYVISLLLLLKGRGRGGNKI